MKTPVATLVAAILLALAGASAGAAPGKLTQVRMSIDEDPITIRLATSLGYLAAEGVEIVPVDLEKLAGEDYLMQEPLMKGQIDASYHWFNHAIFGVRHGFPIKAVMVFNDAPGMTVMVANRVKGEAKGVADFTGRRIAEGAGYGTKSVITNYLAVKAGLPAHSYTPVMLGKEGRQEAVIQGLKDGTVDVMTFQEPVTSALMCTKMVSVLYDLNSKESTAKVLGAAFPAQTLLMSPKYIATFAKSDYSFSAGGVKLVAEINVTSDFDKSVEGQWRATGDKSKVRPAELYTNRFVDKAMRDLH